MYINKPMDCFVALTMTDIMNVIGVNAPESNIAVYIFLWRSIITCQLIICLLAKIDPGSERDNSCFNIDIS